MKLRIEPHEQILLGTVDPAKHITGVAGAQGGGRGNGGVGGADRRGGVSAVWVGGGGDWRGGGVGQRQRSLAQLRHRAGAVEPAGRGAGAAGGVKGKHVRLTHDVALRDTTFNFEGLLPDGQAGLSRSRGDRR